MKRIKDICDKYGIQNWKINPDNGLVDVEGDVDLSKKKLKKIPIKFGMVSGYFICSENQLTTLEGSPNSVGGDFSCGYNKLTTLEGSPNSVGGSFYCGSNKLTTLEGAPKSVGGYFYCCNSHLISIKGVPYLLGGGFLSDLGDIEYYKNYIRNQKINDILNEKN